jgi:hypothetical protein
MADLLFGKNLRKAREREQHFWNQRMKKQDARRVESELQVIDQKVNQAGKKMDLLIWGVLCSTENASNKVGWLAAVSPGGRRTGQDVSYRPT